MLTSLAKFATDAKKAKCCLVVRYADKMKNREKIMIAANSVAPALS